MLLEVRIFTKEEGTHKYGMAEDKKEPWGWMGFEGTGVNS